MRQDQIRNFCIIAHIDHGKSTLADRLIELTGTLDKRLMREQVLRISAKEGTNVAELLEAVVKRVPPPRGDRTAPLRALIFDSYFDRYRGAIPSIRVVDGVLTPGMQVAFGAHNEDAYGVDE